MSTLQITTRHTPTGPDLTVSGDLDYAHAGTLREQVTALTLEPGQRLVLDLAGVEFCDSSGITALLAARNAVQAAGAEIVLASVPGAMLRILHIVGLDQIFTLHPDSGTARRS